MSDWLYVVIPAALALLLATWHAGEWVSRRIAARNRKWRGLGLDGGPGGTAAEPGECDTI